MLLALSAIVACSGDQGPNNAAGPFVTVSAGYPFTCGIIQARGYCWGYGRDGELGNAATTSTTTPGTMAGGLRFTQVSAGEFFACGVTTSHRAYCWGANSAGQLGDGSDSNRTSPVAVSGAISFAMVMAGTGFACGTSTSGAAYCWGYNASGQLGGVGGATPGGIYTPVSVAGNLSFASVSPGDQFACGVTTTGAGYCWGENGAGQLGDSTGTSSSTPVPVAGGLEWSTIRSGEGFACGLTTAELAYCWGNNIRGMLGTGDTVPKQSLSPLPVSGGLRFTDLTTNLYHVCGITPAGGTYCWGYNGDGELGDGTTVDRPGPVAVNGGLRFTAVSAGWYHTCGVTNNGSAYCWGDNSSGELGNGAATGISVTPTLIVRE